MVIDYNNLNDNDKRIVREALNLTRVSQYYFEDNNILLMKVDDMFKYIYIDEIDKFKSAMEFINRISNIEIKNTDLNKTVKQLLLDSNDKVTKISDEIYMYKDM